MPRVVSGFSSRENSYQYKHFISINHANFSELSNQIYSLTVTVDSRLDSIPIWSLRQGFDSSLRHKFVMFVETHCYTFSSKLQIHRLADMRTLFPNGNDCHRGPPPWSPSGMMLAQNARDWGSIPHSGIPFSVHWNSTVTLQTVQLHRKAENIIMHHTAWTATTFFFNRMVAIVTTNILYLRNIVKFLLSTPAGHG